METNKTLDLRYNEMWNTWNNTGREADDFSTALFKRDMVLSWKQLNVSVAKKKNPKLFGRSEVVYKPILDNVSGNVECGTFLGIMGPSGSGKTTLITTISHRTKGNFQGELLLNGRPVSEEAMIKISGFVAQKDINFAQLTVLEHLKLMAILKMDRNVTKKVIKDRINYLSVHLGLNKILDARLSVLSGGERKKVALAVQLINDPPILFCDEITTGLDSYSAAHIINTLRRVAYSGKIVICTIQPASGSFEKFQEIILLTNGRLAYQGSVELVNDVFQKFGYVCPVTYNMADFIVSILNSDSVIDKNNVNEMCELSLTTAQINIKYNSFNKDVQSEYGHRLQVEKLNWITQVLLLLYRSATCFIRDYKEKFLELGTLIFLGVITATPYANLKFDTKAVQNWEGFWLCLVINTVFHFSYSAISTHQIKFSVVHREVSNKVYSLSVYYVSELIILVTWVVIRIVAYCIIVFWIVGVDWVYMQILVFLILALASFSYGSLLSAFFDRIEDALAFSVLYEYLSLPLSGAYLSFRSLPKVLFSLRYLSLFFLGCETVSSLFWERIKSLPCIDVANCMNTGKAVLIRYGFVSEDLYFDLNTLLAFCVIANTLSYFGVLKRMKKQPAY